MRAWSNHRACEMVFIVVLLCLGALWLQSLYSALPRLPADLLDDRSSPLVPHESDVGKRARARAGGEGSVNSRAGVLAGVAGFHDPRAFSTGDEEGKWQSQVGDVIEDVVSDGGSFGLIAFGNTSSKPGGTSAGDVDPLNEEELLVLQQRRSLLRNTEEIDLIVRMPESIIPTFALVCSSVCSKECQEKSLPPIEFLRSPITCSCSDAFAMLHNISLTQLGSSSWRDVKDISYIKRQRTNALCTTMRNCELLGKRGHERCAQQAKKAVEAYTLSPSAADVMGGLERIGGARLKDYFDYVGSTIYGENTIETLEMILDVAMADYPIARDGRDRGVGPVDQLAWRKQLPLGEFVDLGAGRGKMVAAACALPRSARYFSSCRGLEIVPHRVASAKEFLAKILTGFRRAAGLEWVADALISKGVAVALGDITSEQVGRDVLRGASLVYMYNLVWGDYITLPVLAAVARYGMPGRTRVVMHTDIMGKHPHLLSSYDVLHIKKRYTPEEKSRMETRQARRKMREERRGQEPGTSQGGGRVREQDKQHNPGKGVLGGVAGSRHMLPEDEAGYFGSTTFMGSLVVLQLKKARSGDGGQAGG